MTTTQVHAAGVSAKGKESHYASLLEKRLVEDKKNEMMRTRAVLLRRKKQEYSAAKTITHFFQNQKQNWMAAASFARKVREPAIGATRWWLATHQESQPLCSSVAVSQCRSVAVSQCHN